MPWKMIFKSLAVCLTLLFSTSVLADLILAEGKPTGQWYNPDRDGEGFFVEIVNTGGNLQVSVAMYSYDDQGEQLWVVGNVPIDADDTVATVTVFQIDGPVWGSGFDPADKNTTEFGTITVRFPSCKSALFQVRTNGDLEDGDYGLVRLTDIVGIECSDAPPSTPEGVTPGEWHQGDSSSPCMWVAEDGKFLTTVGSQCAGFAFWFDNDSGTKVDSEGNVIPGACPVFDAECDSAVAISADGYFSCVTRQGGLVEGQFTSATHAYGTAYEPVRGEDGAYCKNQWEMTPSPRD